VSMVGKRHPLGSGRSLQADRPPQVHLGGYDPGVGAIQGVDLQALLPRAVGHADEGVPPRKPTPQAIADAVRLTMLGGTLLPAGHRKRTPPHRQQQRVALRMGFIVFQIVGGPNESPLPVDPGTSEVDLNPLRTFLSGSRQVELGPALIDHPASVAVGMAQVEISVVGVAHQVRTIREARIEVADPLVVGAEVDPSGHPQRPRHVSRQIQQGPEITRPLRIDPELAHRPPAIALPARRVGGEAPQDLPPSRPEAQGGSGSPGQGERRPTLARDLAQDGGTAERLTCRGGEEDLLGIGGPARHGGLGAQEGQAPDGPSPGGHHVHLGMPLVATGAGQPGAVWRQPGVRDPTRVGRQAPGESSAGGNLPEIVLTDEDDPVPPEGRLVIIALHRALQDEVCPDSRAARCSRFGDRPGRPAESHRLQGT
jgi:hypothetical protein